VDKILIYVKDFEEAKLVFPYVEKLYKEGYEVAFHSDDWEVVELLALARVLVVNSKVYYPDIAVGCSSGNSDATHLTLSKFLEVAS